MNLIIPFSKDIKFNTNISEITSITLEHDYTINDNELLGNFEVSGDYKSHEVSVNKEPFEYVIPFSVDITNDINIDSIDFNILDFTYEIVDNNTLRVNIEYSVRADEIKKDEALERIEINDLDSLIKIEENNEKKVEQTSNENIENNQINNENQDEIINSIKDQDESFTTYNIHILKESEDIDTICSKYKTNKEILDIYNDISNIKLGDKIIIPEVDE